MSGLESWMTEGEDCDRYADLADQAMGEINRYLPVGANPSWTNLSAKACEVAEGNLTAQEAANQLSNKKINVKRK